MMTMRNVALGRNFVLLALIFALFMFSRSAFADAPVISFVAPSPANATIGVNFAYINVTANVTAATVSGCVLENLSFNYSMTPNMTLPHTNVSCALNMTGMTDGTHLVKIFANDTANVTTVTIRVFTTDTTGPSISFNSPANQTYGVNFTYINVTVADALTNVTGVTVEIDGAANVSMSSEAAALPTKLSNFFYNKTNLLSGQHVLKIYANDTFNTTTNLTRVITTDVEGPVISNESSTSNATTNYTFAFINYTITDALNSVTGCKIEFGGTNITMINKTALPGTSVNCFYNLTNATTGFAEGYNTFKIYSNDTFNNVNVSTKAFTVDYSGPSIYLLLDPFPGNQTVGKNFGYINVSVFDNFTAIANATFENETGNYTMTKVNTGSNASFYLNVTGQADGTHLFKIWANDTFNQRTSSVVIGFTTDATGPTISLDTAPANETINVSYAFFNVTLTDSTNVTGCKLEWDGTNTTINVSAVPSGSAYCFVNKTVLAQGGHTLKIFANDTFNTTTTSSRSFTVDTEGPVMFNESSTTVNQTYNQTFFYVNFTVSDLQTNITGCVLQWDHGSTNHTINVTYTAPNSAFCYVNKTNLTEGTHYAKIWANDSFNNTNVSLEKQITLDLSPPAVTFQSPTPSDGGVIGVNYTNVSVSITDATSNVTGCYLIWNGVRINMTNTSVMPAQTVTFKDNATNMTNLTNGQTYTYSVVANDTFNWTKTTTARTFTFNLSPQISISSPGNTTLSSTNVTLNYTVTTGPAASTCWYTNSTGPNVTLSDCTSGITLTALEGSNMLTIFANNAWGYNGTAIVYYTVTLPTETAAPASSSGSSGGGSGAATNTQTVSASKVSVLAGESVSFQFTMTAVDKIEINVNDAVQSGAVTVKEIGQPTTASSVTQGYSGAVFKYLNITPNFADSKVNSGKITFKVSNYWITTNSLKPANVKLFKLTGSSWTVLPTVQISFDGVNYVFEGTTTSFSTYAIAGTTQPIIVQQPTTPVETQPTTPSTPSTPSTPTQPSQPAQQTARTISILYPSNYALIEGSTVEVQLSETGLTLVSPGGAPSDTQGHFHVYLDGQQELQGTSTHYTFYNVAAGTHTITAELQRNDRTSFSPQLLTSVTVTVATPASNTAQNDMYVYLAVIVIIIIAVAVYKLKPHKKIRRKHKQAAA